MPLTSLQATNSLLSLEWTIAVSPTRTWSLLTEETHLKQWLGKLAQGTVAPEASFDVDHGDGYKCSSSVLDFETERALRYSWAFPDEPTSEVSWEVSPVPEGTKLKLDHSGLSDLIDSYRDGWLVHLTYLALIHRFT
ncbi:SRPBCC domain-containing protein [Brevibacterium sp.]|uniref:SRPBCC domain-containing protein n=1 Tax=Brevibacterium sp. TaxID=1701 RepID=UPI00264980EC|nr:SRPBCC domain-containing protein [Brevibacterium sp.]